jgi:hypothetical protein
LIAGGDRNVYRFAMMAWRRISLMCGIFFLLFLTLACIGLYFILQSAQFTIWLQAEISQRSGFEVHLAQLKYRPPFSIIAGAVEISKAPGISFKTPQLSATLTPFDLLSRTVYRLDIEAPMLQLDVLELSKSATKTTGEFALRSLIVHDGTLLLKKGESTVFELPKINLSAQNINLGGQTGLTLRADVPKLNGIAELAIKGQLREWASEVVIRPKETQSLFGSQKSPTAAREILRLRAKFHAPENEKADATVESKFQKLPIGDGKFTGSLNTRLEFDPGLTVVTFSGQTDVAEFPGALIPAMSRLATGNAAANFTGTFSLASKALSLKSFQLITHLGKGDGEGVLLFDPQPTVSKAKLVLREMPLDMLKSIFPAPVNRWTYRGSGQLELDLRGAWNALKAEGIARSDSVQVSGDNLSFSNLSVTAPFEWTNSALRIKEAKLTTTKPAYAGKESWQGAAERMQVSASLDFKADMPLKVTGRLAAVGAKFNSPDSSKVGENLTLSGPFDVTLSPGKSLTSIDGKFAVETGELLWGKFFGDLAPRKPMLEVDADYANVEDRLICRRCSISLGGVGAVDLLGSIEHLKQAPVLRLQGRSDNLSPSGIFEFFLRETYNRQYPLLDKLAVSGQAAVQLQIDGSFETPTLRGNLSMKNGEIAAKSNDWQVAAINLDLPFHLSFEDSPDRNAATPALGSLSIERARFGNQQLAPIRTTVSLANNALRLHQPLRLTLFGGEVELRNLAWPDIIRDPRAVTFSADTKRLQMQNLTEAFNWPRFSGQLNGAIPEVESAGNTLRTRGEIQAELFGGRLLLSKLEIDNPFSALASIKMSAKLESIQLEQLSQTFAFGRISGILEGSIDDLVITDGQPAQLRADLHSVERSGVDQRISVDALNKITVLSSGQEAGALYSGLAGFFDSFRYSKLGFKATLRNDRLTLRGVESQGDTELLVVGSFLPPTVNIVSHTQEIAFSELLRRLQRIKSDKPSIK